MYTETFKKYLNDLASNKPAPGGGSAAAHLGAVATALLAKVANFTVGKEKYKKSEKEMKDILTQSQGLIESLNNLCSEDAAAYKKFSDALKLPAGTERKMKLQVALKEATSVPVEVCKDVHQAIKFCLPLAERGNRNLITDTAIGAIMLECAFQSALLNVEINLKSIKDSDFIIKIREILEPMEEEVSLINQEVKNETEKYLGK